MVNETDQSEITNVERAEKIRAYVASWNRQSMHIERIKNTALEHHKLLISYSGKSRRTELELDLRDRECGIEDECAVADKIAEFLEMSFGLYHAQVLSMLVFRALMKNETNGPMKNTEMLSGWIHHLHSIMNGCRVTLEKFFSDPGKFMPINDDISASVEDGEFFVETRTPVLDAVEKGEIEELPNGYFFFEAWEEWQARANESPA